MSFLSPSTNGLSTGSPARVCFLGLYDLLELVTGLIHFVLPDGGAGVIAGLDLTQNKHTIIGVFARMGARVTTSPRTGCSNADAPGQNKQAG